MKKTILKTATAVAACLLFIGSADAGLYKGSSEFLTGDWNGYRTSLYDAGIDTQIKYTADYWNLLDGGLKTGSNLVSALDAAVELDGATLYGISGNTIKIRVVHIGGGKFNQKRVGSVEGVDNLEGTENSIKLQEFWTEQKFAGGKYRIRAGVQDVKSDFAKTEMTANFSKPTMQLMPTLSGSSIRNATATYPDTALALTFEYAPSNLSYARFGMFDGAPGHATKNRGNYFKVNSREGYMAIAEFGLTPRVTGDEDRKPNKLAFGAWRYNKKQDDIFLAGKKAFNQGIYALMAYEFYGDRDGRTLGAFVKGGLSDEATHQVDFDLQTGFVARGFIPSRQLGEIGLGYSQADNSSKYMKANPGADRREYSFNAYYRDQIIPSITVQPEYQYISNPGSDTSVNSASILGVRLEFNL